MSLAWPLALLLLGLAVPIAWSFLARRRAPRAVVGSVVLLRRAAASASARRIAPRVREPLALLLTLAVLAALALALAGPACQDSVDGRLIVVVDASASMGRRQADGRAVLDAQRQAVRDQLQARGARGPMALIEAREHATVRVGLTHDAGAVVDALDRVSPAGRGGGIDEALMLAAELCRDRERDTVVVIGDHLPEAPDLPCAIARPPAADTQDNAGITELVVRRGDGLGLIEVLIGVASDRAEVLDLSVRVDDRLVDTARLEVDAGEVAWSLRRLGADGSEIDVRILDHADAHPDDDRAVAAVPERVLRDVALVTSNPQGFLATALRLHPGVDVEIVDAEGAEALREHDLVVLETGAVPPAGVPVLTFGADAARVVGIEVGPSAASPSIVRWAFDDPRFAFVDLDDVQIARAVSLTVPPGGDELIASDIGPLLVAGRADGRTVTAAGFLPTDTDLVLRVGFLHLIANLVESSVPAVEPDGGSPGSAAGRDEVLRSDPGAWAHVPILAAAGAAGWGWSRWLVVAALVGLLLELAWGGLASLRRGGAR